VQKPRPQALLQQISSAHVLQFNIHFIGANRANEGMIKDRGYCNWTEESASKGPVAVRLWSAHEAQQCSVYSVLAAEQ